MTTEETVSVPHHVEDAVATIAAIHAAHYREARALQKAVSRATGGIAQPFHVNPDNRRDCELGDAQSRSSRVRTRGARSVSIPTVGDRRFDRRPLPCCNDPYYQRHDDEMATRREQITLELAILSEQKSAKIIALLEELRRNDPNQGNDRDEVAEAMAQPANAQVVLDAIRAAEKGEDGD